MVQQPQMSDEEVFDLPATDDIDEESISSDVNESSDGLS
jgi:hypothetical protein